jgi:integrase
MGLAGVGNSEAAALQWKHVAFPRKEIRLYRNKTDIGFVIPLFPAVRPLLDQLWGKSDQKPETKVFRINSARKALTNACKRLQLPHYTQRSLRRMFITKCIYLNVPFPTIGAWQGHSDNGQTILRYYGQLIARRDSDLATRVT